MRCGIRAVELQPDFKTIQVWSKMLSTFRLSQQVRIQIIFTTRMILSQFANGRKYEGVLVRCCGTYKKDTGLSTAGPGVVISY